MHNNTEISNTHVACSNCGHDIDVNEILARQLEAKIQKKYDSQLEAARIKLENDQKTIEARLQKLTAKEKSIDTQINAGIENRINTERSVIAKEERAKAEALAESNTKTLQQELKEQSEKLKELNESKTAFLRLQREMDSLQTKLETENEQKLNKILAEERTNIQQTEANKNELIVKEQKQLIETLGNQLKDAHRKAEQGSTQSQGEAQELAVEEWLQNQFPHDDIEEIKKGALGGDCIQTINTTGKIGCGTIYYESKRTKDFSPGWIEKFKADIRDRNTDVGVLVSQARPRGMERMGWVDGIWVCNYDEFKGLCQVLRNHIIQLDQTKISQVNTGDKMSMIYDFLQSNEFRLQVEAIVEGFTQMKIDLDKEKRSIQGHWKKREKQIDKVLLNTGNMYNSIKGIAGASIQPVAALEFESAG